VEVDLDLDLDLAELLQTDISKSVNQSHGIRNKTESVGEKKFSKIDTIGDAYIMVAWLNEGLDPYEHQVKHAPKVKHAPELQHVLKLVVRY
jgi:hypothetical protein